MTLKEFNKLDKETAAKELFSCCASQTWLSSLMNYFPFVSGEELVNKATAIWYDECKKEDWLESFTHHPKIGDKKSLKEKFAGKEQAAVASASDVVIEALAKVNVDYENKFGFIFIVCATGKSAEEMLIILQSRLSNTPADEIEIAAEEQNKITKLRIEKLLQ